MRTNDNWIPPEGLGYGSARPVRLSGQGIAMASLTAVLVIGAIALGIFLGRTARREAEERAMLVAQGVTADAVVTRHWRTGDKSRTPRISYRFDYEGNIYTGNVKAPLARWKELPVGAHLQVRFVPSQPAISHPIGWEGRDLPVWFPYVIAAVTALIGLVPLLSINGQMRLLAEGRPAQGRVTGFGKAGKEMVIRYEFQTLNGSTFQGKAPARKSAVTGSEVCVLYDPENPKRNSTYPLALVKLG